jgi:hypothetical protein
MWVDCCSTNPDLVAFLDTSDGVQGLVLVVRSEDATLLVVADCALAPLFSSACARASKDGMREVVGKGGSSR